MANRPTKRCSCWSLTRCWLFRVLVSFYTGCFVTCGTPLRELIVRLKIMKKSSHINICPVCLRLWDIMNFLFSITFTRDARNHHLAFEDKPARVLSVIWLLFWSNTRVEIFIAIFWSKHCDVVLNIYELWKRYVRFVLMFNSRKLNLIFESKFHRIAVCFFFQIETIACYKTRG